MRAEMEAMRAQMQAMDAKIDGLESQLAAEKARAVAVPPAPPPAPSITAKTATTIAWDGAPRIEAAVDPKNPDAGRWSFKPRGRLQLDVAGVDAPNAIGGNGLGVATEVRRAYLGFEGTLPGNFGYRLEADVATSAVELIDFWITYKASPELTLTVGQHKPFTGLEEQTSDIFTNFMERAAFTSAFGFERRVGVSATWVGKTVLVLGGVFADNAADLNNPENNSYSIDGRAVFMPKLGGGQLHLGGSLHHREFNDAATTVRYRARPFVRTTDVRLIDTRPFSADGETSYGAEAAFIKGRFHLSSEGHWIVAHRPGLADPRFFGGYVEAGLMLTDDSVGYRAGLYDRVRPKRPLGSGGIGAFQLNARYDMVDLSDAGVIGGRQQIIGASLLWYPNDYVRFVLNYGRIRVEDAAVAAGLDRNYGADAMGMRAQFDF